MRRLKGPELKAPDFLVDLFYDLRDRRLLPLVALVLAAIVAVPFLLGSSEKPQPGPDAQESAAEAATAGASGVEAARLTVVEAKPGLRDYRKRLARRTPTDPFKQRHSGPMLNGSELNSQSETSSSAPAEVTSTTTTSTEFAPPASTGPSNDGGKSASGGGKPQIVLFSFAIDVKIIRTETKADGSKEQSEPETRKHVLPPAALPSEKTPAVTYMGISPKTKKPLFLISTDVTAVYGDGECVSGTSTCQLLEVEPGFPETFVYGESDVRYKINVLSVKPVVAGRF